MFYYSGTIDALTFLGRLLGAIFTLFFHFPSLKFAFTVQAILQTFLLCVVFIFIYDMPESFVKPVLAMTMLISGFLRAFSMAPKILIANNSNPEDDKFALSVWPVLVFIGDVVSLLLVNWLINNGVKENSAFIIFVAIFLLSALFQQISIQEV